ncbi:MAG: PIN domain-containing protein, partial [Pseudomonadota bacterium]
MKILLDACVLYPTVQREILLKTARAGVFTPLWSDRILEEWRRAAARHGPVGEAQGGGGIAVMRGGGRDG